MAIELGGRESGDDGVLDFGGGWVFLNFGEHTVDKIRGIPRPAILDGASAADFTGFTVDVAVGVVVAGHFFLGFLKGFVGVS